MSELTLTDFLLARIAEDEYVARLADAVTDKIEDDWQDVTQPITHAQTQGRPQESWAKRYGHAYQLISSMSPARVLADCAAKRRGVEMFTASLPLGDGAYSSGLYDALRALTLPYADHPDYREEWRP